MRIATSEDDFEVVANLRATAFYDDLLERQAARPTSVYANVSPRVCAEGKKGVGGESGEADVGVRKVRVFGGG